MIAYSGAVIKDNTVAIFTRPPISDIKKIKIKIDKFNKNFTWLIAKLKEGKNREIRNICKHFSWHIVKLVRIQFGPYKLGHLKEGQIEEINIKTNA